MSPLESRLPAGKTETHRLSATPRYSGAGACFILLVIVTGFFWKLLTTQYTWMDHPDMAYMVLPWYQFEAVSLHSGRFPLWDPHVWGGQPLLGQLQPGAAYPLNWPLFLAPLKHGHINPLWLHLQFIMSHILAALFCYALCRELKLSRPASILGGAAFALSGVVGAIGWPQVLNGAIWIPLVVLFFLRAVRGERTLTSASIAGTFLGVSFLSGHHQIPVLISLLMGFLWLFEIGKRRGRGLIAMSVFWIFTVLAGALQILPGYELGKRSIRWVGSQNPVFWGQSVPYSVHQQLALRPADLLGLVRAEGGR